MKQETRKTYKYRLKLSKEQVDRVDDWINVSRTVYNLAKETKEYAYNTQRVSLSGFDLMKQLTDAKKEFDWLKGPDADMLQLTINQLDLSYKKYFSDLSSGLIAQKKAEYIAKCKNRNRTVNWNKYRGIGKPKWARKDEYSSIGFKHVSQVSDYVFKLPKFGTVTIFKDRQPEGDLKQARISRKNGRYYLTISAKLEIDKFQNTGEKSIGLDVGITKLISTSNGNHIENPRHTKKYERRLRVAQRSLSKKVLKSNSWNKQRKEVSILQEKIANTRQDFLQKTSTEIVNNHDVIVVEDLEIRNMVKFGSLSKHISDASWGEFFRQLEYKSNWQNKSFIKVNPKYTSQTCSCCGGVCKENRKSQSNFECVSCGFKENADINAAKNILSEGIALYRQREALACA